MTMTEAPKDAAKVGRPRGTRNKPRPEVIDVIRSESLIAMHEIVTDPKQAASDRIEAARLLLRPYMDRSTGEVI